MDILNFLVEPLTLPFMLRAFVVTVIAAAVCALLSCWLVLLGWSLMGDAISHAVLPGVVLAYIFGAPFAVGAVIAALVAVALIGGVRRSGRVREDAAIGIVFTTMFAFGLVLISVTPSNTDLNHILFGNVLGVSWSDVWQVAVLAVVVAAVLLVKRRDFVLYAFDPGFAQAVGLRPRLLGALLLIMLALTSVVALQIVGVVLVVAMLVIPGSTARLMTDRFVPMLAVSVGVSLVGTLTGLYASYYADVSPGGAVVVTQGILFALAYVFAPRYGLLGRIGLRQTRPPHVVEQRTVGCRLIVRLCRVENGNAMGSGPALPAAGAHGAPSLPGHRHAFSGPVGAHQHRQAWHRARGPGRGGQLFVPCAGGLIPARPVRGRGGGVTDARTPPGHDHEAHFGPFAGRYHQ